LSPTPIVSVVMPVYNGAGHVRAAVQSVLDQTCPDFELVAVDDGSTDDSWTVLEALAEKDGRVRPHRLAANAGHHVASNVAMERALGRYLVRLDQDDLAEPTRLARTIDAFDADPGVGLVHSQYVRLLPDGRRSLRTPPSTDGALRVTQMFRNTVCHSALGLRAEVLDQLGDGYRDLAGPQDYDLIVRALEHARSYCIPEPLAVYRHEAMAMTEQFSDRMERAVEEISRRQLVRYVPDARVPAARRTFNLAAAPGDGAESVRDVRAVFAGVTRDDRLRDPDEVARFAHNWTGRAMRSALARGGGLRRSAAIVGELVRGDVTGTGRWTWSEAATASRKVRRRLAGPGASGPTAAA
jgi:glycosyltransferase involved in cell wall biosynthesis